MLVFAAISALSLATADRPQDVVKSLPGFEQKSDSWGFTVYSGFIDVPGPIDGYETKYDSLKIHYQFHTSQRSFSSDPVVAWHNGGPGVSSIVFGLYGEMGAFRIGDGGNYLNPWSWNKVANMLYLESPAGSGSSSGYSECISGGKPVICRWDDVSQGKAYAHTLRAFFQDFPEFASNELYMTGESYFGQYGPNIAHYIVNHEPFSSELNLKGIALGNACWGGNESLVACIGPSEDRIDVDMLFGHGFISQKLKKQIDAECHWPTEYVTGDDTDPSGKAGWIVLSDTCKTLLHEVDRQAGPYDVLDMFNNCPNTERFLKRTNHSSRWLAGMLRRGLHKPHETRETLKALNGGYEWDCLGDSSDWILRDDVREALHLTHARPGASRFDYTSAGPASVTLYPELMKKLRIMYYSGDADMCVPYPGYEDMLASFEESGLISETSPWAPYFTSNSATAAGYLTKYTVVSTQLDIRFVTVRLAGHMAPQFMPEASFLMFKDWLAAGESSGGALV